MNPRYAIHEEIDRFLNGQMGVAERRAFEEQLASNASVRAEFEAQKIAHDLIFENALIDLKKQMQHDMNGGGTLPPSAGTERSYRNWLIGLGGGILCISALYYFFSSGEKANSPLAAKQSSAPATQQAPVKKEVVTSGSANTPAPAAVQVTPVLPTPASGETPAPQSVTPAAADPAPVTPAATGTPAPEHHVAAPPATSTPKPLPADPKDSGNNHNPPPADPPQAAAASGAYTFQPEVEGNWTLPYQEGKQGTFRLMSRSGAIVYQSHFSSGSSQQWNGNDAAGVALPAGYYIYLIEYDQGGAEKGSLTILR